MAQAGAQFKIEVSMADLMQFGEALINKVLTESQILGVLQQTQNRPSSATDGETYLTSAEAAKMCNVCPTTLWAWKKAGYLVPCKIGRSNRYALSDIQRLLSKHGVDESKARLGTVPANPIQQQRLRQNGIAVR